MYCSLIKIFIVCVILFLNEMVHGIIPDYIKVCKRSEPNVNDCIRNSVEQIRPKLLEGIPELEVPPIEPMEIPEVSLTRGPKSANIEALISNVRVWGPANFVIQTLESDLENNKFDFKILLPKLYFEGKYNLNARILLLNLHGNGNINGTFTNYKSNVSMQGHKIKKGDAEHLLFDRLKLKLSIGKAKLYFSNLFNGDPVLGPAVNQIINDNSQTFINEIAPALERSIADVFTDIANKITLKFTYDELFP
ncbi:protein takeout-like [Chrysoperla carnea]|uniref:protein takeout-like n=1 Tax=Chrysoperla carnea TaxID=189513 RepID=UPI001D072372|nr:protein takeout-like [Chrysoperla carnea]